MLRALLLLLACMNLGVAAWWWLHEDAPPAPLPAQDAGVPTLRLLGEAGRPSRGEVIVEPTGTQAPLPADAQCLSLGPFVDSTSVRRAMDRLLPHVERIQFREVPAVELRGYRVFLPPAGSRDEALQVARALAGRGISDYYVVTAGPQQDTISLGLFRDLENATRRRDEVAALGYSPTIEPRTESVSQWWIDLAAAPAFSWQQWLPDATGLRAETASCR